MYHNAQVPRARAVVWEGGFHAQVVQGTANAHQSVVGLVEFEPDPVFENAQPLHPGQGILHDGPLFGDGAVA